MKVWWFMVIEIHANKNAVKAANGGQAMFPSVKEGFLVFLSQNMCFDLYKWRESVTPFAVQQTDVHFR